MEFLKCGGCGFEIATRAARRPIENCPRCLARGATAAPMFPAGELPRATRSAGASRRASQGALAASIRDLRSSGGRPRAAR